MSQAQTSPDQSYKIPVGLAGTVAVVCFTPVTLNLMGVDFGTTETESLLGKSATLSASALRDEAHLYLAGSFVHTLLEWSAFCAALFTAALAFVHFAVRRDVVVPVIAIALFWAGCMDAFHTLAADRLITATTDNPHLIPFTWAICRLFNVLIIITGVSLILARREVGFERGGMAFVSVISLAFGVAAYVIIRFCATSELLPTVLFPDSLITRPWDLGPLVLYVFAGASVLPMLHRRRKDHFSFCLWLSVLPHVATQAHMAFGSAALYDNGFNIAHFLKIVAYLIPLTGIALDYVSTYREELLAQDRLRRSENTQAEQSNRLETILRSIGHGVVVTDEQGLVVLINTLAMEQLGMIGRDAVGADVLSFIEDENFIRVWRGMAERGEDFDKQEVRVRHPVTRVLWATRTRIRTSEGAVRGYVTILQDVTREREIDRMKTDFVSSVSHELRTPLTNIKGFTSIILGDDALDEASRREFLRIIEDETDRLTSLIEDLLEISSIESGKIKLAREPYDVGEVIDAVLSSIHPDIEKRNLTLDMRVGQQLPELVGDRKKVQAILLNLLSNAVKFTDDGGGISIESASSDGYVTISISDTGLGIPNSAKERIFDRFYRVAREDREIPGTGLGLSIAQELARLHGGHIEVQSELGKGSTFTLYLRRGTNGKPERTGPASDAEGESDGR